MSGTVNRATGGTALAPALLRGGVIVVAGAAGARLLQAATWFLLARAVEPADFGAFAIAAIFVNALALLPGLGLGTALLASREDPRALAPSALSAALLGGTLLAAVAFLIGEGLARSRGADAGRCVAVLGLSLAFQGAGSIACAALDRALRFGARAAAELSGGASCLVVALAAAAAGMGALALPLGLAAAAAVTAITACFAARLAPARRPDFGALRAATRIGALVLATSLLQWLFVSSDVWIVERRFGRTALGEYGVAFQLALLPATLIGLLLSRLLLPALVAARAHGLDRRAGFLRTARVAASVAAMATAGLALAAGPAIALLYGDRFVGAAALVPPLALYAFGRVLGGLAGPALLASGRARAPLLLVALQDLVAIPLACVVPASLGARGVATIYALVTAAAGAAALLLATRALRAEAAAAGASRAVPAAGTLR